MSKSNEHPIRRLSVSLSTLFFCLTICAICVAWLVDHRSLKSQIPAPKYKKTATFSLYNASPEPVIKALKKYYPNEELVAGPSLSAPKRECIVGSVDIQTMMQLAVIIRRFDRPWYKSRPTDAAAEDLTSQEDR